MTEIDSTPLTGSRRMWLAVVGQVLAVVAPPRSRFDALHLGRTRATRVVRPSFDGVGGELW